MRKGSSIFYSELPNIVVLYNIILQYNSNNIIIISGPYFHEEILIQNSSQF